MPPRNRSVALTTIVPIAPVRDTCVPPQAERSKSCDVDEAQRAFALRFLAQRAVPLLLRRPAKRIVTGRSSQTTRLASSSARDDFRSGHLAREIDGRVVGAEVKALGATLQQRDRTQPTARAGRCAAACGRSAESSRPLRERVGPPAVAIEHVRDPPVVEIDDIDDRAAPSVPVSYGWPPEVG